MDKRLYVALAAVLVLAAPFAAWAGPPAARSLSASHEGSHAAPEAELQTEQKHAPAKSFSATSHRRFDDVGHWKKVFDDPKRDDWQKPAEVIAALGVNPGDSVADLGAGTGYFLPYLTRAVGTEGVVFAVEVEPNLVTHLRERAEKAGWAQVVPVLASLDNARLPCRSLDLVLIVDTFHHLDDRAVYLRALTRSLKPQGRVAIVDWKKGDLPQGPGDAHKLARDQVAAEMDGVGYTLVAESKMLPYQYMLVFAPDADTGATEKNP